MCGICLCAGLCCMPFITVIVCILRGSNYLKVAGHDFEPKKMGFTEFYKVSFAHNQVELSSYFAVTSWAKPQVAGFLGPNSNWSLTFCLSWNSYHTKRSSI